MAVPIETSRTTTTTELEYTSIGTIRTVTNQTVYLEDPRITIPSKFDRSKLTGITQVLDIYNPHFQPGSLRVNIERDNPTSHNTHYYIQITGTRLHDQRPVSEHRELQDTYDDDVSLSIRSIEAVRGSMPKLLGTDQKCLRDEPKLYDSEFDAQACSQVLNDISSDKSRSYEVKRIIRTFAWIDWLEDDQFQVVIKK